MNSLPRQVLPVISTWLITGLLAGCSTPYFLVTSDFVVNDSRESPPEIVQSQTYREAIPDIKYLVVKAPEGCANETATQSTGEAASQGVLLKTTCGIEMAELERALTKAGFQVISWTVLQQKVLKEELTPNAAAKALGAEALFQINSLERSLIQTGQDARWERRFFESNENGEQLNPASLSQNEGNQLISQIKQKETALINQERLSVTINASASLVETGETVWFYEWTHAEIRDKDETVRVLAKCEDGKCQAISPNGGRQALEESLITGSSEAISKTKNVKDIHQSLYHKLLREVVTNLADSFKNPS